MTRVMKYGLLLGVLGALLWRGVYYAASSTPEPDTTPIFQESQPPVVLHLTLVVEQSRTMNFDHREPEYDHDPNGLRFEAIQQLIEYLAWFQKYVLRDQGRIMVSVAYYNQRVYLVNFSPNPDQFLTGPLNSNQTPSPDIWLDLSQIDPILDMTWLRQRLSKEICAQDDVCAALDDYFEDSPDPGQAVAVATNVLERAGTPLLASKSPYHHNGLILLSSGVVSQSDPIPPIPPWQFANTDWAAYVLLLNKEADTPWLGLEGQWAASFSQIWKTDQSNALPWLDNAEQFEATLLSMAADLLKGISLPSDGGSLWGDVRLPNQNSSCLSSPRSAYTFEVEPFTTALQIVSAHHLAPLTSGVDGLCIHKPDSASINGYSNLCESWDLFEIVHRTDSSRHFPIQVWEFKYPPAGNWCVDTLNNTPISSSKSIFGTDLIHRNYDYADLTLDGLGSQHVQYGKEEVTVRVEPPDYLSQYGMLPQLELTRLNFPDVTSVRLRSVSPGEYRGEVYFPESDTYTLNLKVITAENSKEIPLPTPISTNVSVEPVTFTYDCSPSPDATCLLPGYGVTVEIETWIGGEMRTAASHHIIWEIELKVSGGEDAERLPAPTCDNGRCSSTYQEQGDIEGRFDQREIIVSGTTDVQGTPQPIPAELKPRFTCTYARQPIVPFSADGSADNQILVTASNPSIRIGPSIAELDRECQDGKWLVNIDDGNELRLSGTLTSQDNTVLHEFNVDVIDERFTVELPAKLTSAPGSFQLQFDVYLGTAKIFVSDSLSVVIEDARSASE